MNIGIRSSATSIKIETGCKAGDKCLFPQCKVDEQQNKRVKKGHFPKRREREDKAVVAILKSVPQLGCVSQDSDALVSQGTKEFRRIPMQIVLNAIRKVRFARSGPRWEKQKSSLVSEVPSLSFPRIGPTKRLDDNSDVPKARLWDLAKNIYKLRRDRQGYILLSRRGMGTPGCVNKRAGKREFVVGSRASMHTVSEKDLNSAELATMRTSKSPTTVMTANGEVQTIEEATVCQAIGLIRQSYVS